MTCFIRLPNPLYFVAVFFLALLQGCGGGGASTTSATPETTAAFTTSTATPATGQAVLFSDTSSGTPTAWAWEFGDGSTSSQQNTGHVYAATGSYTVKLTITTASGSASASKQVVVGAPAAGGAAFTMDQTVSEVAQGTTLAFAGLAMMTGNLEAQSFFPPGKVADYTGFQYLRDNDPDNMGHNTDFLTRVANNVLYILTDAQLTQLKTLATTQLSEVQGYGYQRFTLMQAFRQLIDAPATSLGLSAVKAASRALYLVDGQISFERALLYANTYNSMNASQKAYLDAMKGKGFNSWPDITEAQVQSKLSGLDQGTKVLVMTYASDLYSWYAGSLDADIYFCPERHGTYFGSFYMKDAPAVGVPGYSINEQLTATAGSALIDPAQNYVTASQATLMSSLVDTQRDNLYAGASNIVQVRTDIALLLRGLRTSTANADAVRTKVLALSGSYGELDGENNYNYARVFAQVYASLSTAQKAQLATLRGSILSGTYADGTPFDFTDAETPYLYSDPITDPSVLATYLAAAQGLFQ